MSFGGSRSNEECGDRGLADDRGAFASLAYVNFCGRAGPAIGGEDAHARRGAAHRGEYRQVPRPARAVPSERLYRLGGTPLGFLHCRSRS
jgi:hypothetical protein